MNRLLVVTIEPPPTSSGLGTLWAKLAGNGASIDFQIDFFGPDPLSASPYGISGIEHPGCLHKIGCPPLARLASVKRNKTQGIQKLFWSVVRAPFFCSQRVFGGADPYNAWFVKKINALLPSLIASGQYSAVAVHVPPLEIADSVFIAARNHNVPFVFVIGDPIGHRDEEGDFFPNEPELQKKLIDGSEALVITKQTYERYYSKIFKIADKKVVFSPIATKKVATISIFVARLIVHSCIGEQ